MVVQSPALEVASAGIPRAQLNHHEYPSDLWASTRPPEGGRCRSTRAPISSGRDRPRATLRPGPDLAWGELERWDAACDDGQQVRRPRRHHPRQRKLRLDPATGKVEMVKSENNPRTPLHEQGPPEPPAELVDLVG